MEFLGCPVSYTHARVASRDGSQRPTLSTDGLTRSWFGLFLEDSTARRKFSAARRVHAWSSSHALLCQHIILLCQHIVFLCQDIQETKTQDITRTLQHKRISKPVTNNSRLLFRTRVDRPNQHVSYCLTLNAHWAGSALSTAVAAFPKKLDSSDRKGSRTRGSQAPQIGCMHLEACAGHLRAGQQPPPCLATAPLDAPAPTNEANKESHRTGQRLLSKEISVSLSCDSYHHRFSLLPMLLIPPGFA